MTPSAKALKAKRQGSRSTPGKVVLYVGCGVLAVIFALPFYLMLSDAFKTAQEIIQIPPSLYPAHATLDNFKTVLTTSPYLRWYVNSLLVGAAVTTLTLFTSSLAGYIFAKFDFRLKNVIFVALLSTMMVPFPVLLIPSYLIANHLHLLNTLWALIIPGIVSAFGVFLMRQFIAGIPSELIEAARIDGAGEFTIFRRVILPLVGAPLSALGIFTFLASWNDYLWPLVAINDQNKMVVPLALTFFNSQHAQRYDLVMAAATMAVVPIFAVFVVFQRRITSAFVLTGVK